jgi:pilus assembly protein CpaE
MARILVVDDTPMMIQLASLTLGKAGHEVRGAENGVQGVAIAKEWRPDLVIMDVMMPEMDGYEATRRIRANPPTALTPILVITTQDTISEKMAAFEAGADDYMTKPYEALELQARVDVHLKRASLVSAGPQEVGAPKAAGKVVACFSLRGGSGVSMLACNLSVALSQLWSRPTLLLDMVMTGGHSALMLNLPVKLTWADLAETNPEEYDVAFVEQLLVHHPSGARLLSSPIRVQDADLVTAPHVAAVLTIAQTQYDTIVADLPHDFRDTTLAVLDRASMILMPFAPELASIRSVAAALEVFRALQYAPEQVRLILNWTFPKSPLPQAEIEKALKHKIDLVIPCDRDDAVRSINRGEPMTAGAASSPLGALLEDYAFDLSRTADSTAAPDEPSEAWRRAAGRVAKSGGIRKT